MKTLVKSLFVIDAILAILLIACYFGQKAYATATVPDSDGAECDSCETAYIQKIKQLPLDVQLSTAQLDSLDQMAMELNEDLCSKELYERVRAFKKIVPEPSPSLCMGFYTHFVNDRLKLCDYAMSRQIRDAYERWRWSVKACYPNDRITAEAAECSEESIDLLLLQTFCDLLDGDSGVSRWFDLGDHYDQLQDISKKLSIKEVPQVNLDTEKEAWVRLYEMMRSFYGMHLAEYLPHNPVRKGATDRQVINDRLVWQSYWG